MNGFTAVLRKELTQMLRDRATLLFSIVIPVFELLLFVVIDMNARNIPTVVFDQSRSQESRRLLEQFGATSYLQVIEYVQSRGELERAIVSGRAGVVLPLAPDSARALGAGREATDGALIDGSASPLAN